MAEQLIQEESARLGRDRRWSTIRDPTERALRLRAAAEQCAQDRILIEQKAESDPRPVDAIDIEREIQRQIDESGCRSTFDRSEFRRLAVRNLRVRRVYLEMAASAVMPRTDEIEAFFNAHRQNFPRPEMFHASHIVKYVNHEQSEEHAEAGIEMALAELEAGMPFAEVATRHSDCKDKDGDLGRFPAGHMVDEFEQVLRALKPGQRSGIFTTPFGFHIAFLHMTEVAGSATFEEVRSAIERVLTFAREHEAYQRAAAEIRSRADIQWIPEPRVAES